MRRSHLCNNANFWWPRGNENSATSSTINIQHARYTLAMLLRSVPLITGLLPIIAIHVSLLLAINAGAVPACNPYLEGCTSISATGRYAPGSFVFKPAMTLEVVFMICYWLLNVAWLRTLYRENQSSSGNPGRLTGILGCTGALFLVVYVTFLGSQEPVYEFMRRFGVYVYFGCSVIAQLTLVHHVSQASRIVGDSRLAAIALAQRLLALVPFVLGVLNLVLKSVLENARPAENIIEWIFALLMHCYFVLTYFGWRQTGFDWRFSVQSRELKGG